MTKSRAGFNFGDYRHNWKLKAMIFERDTPELMKEVYPELMGADPRWMTLREYYCPLSYTLLEIEAVPPGYPIVHTFEPDLEGPRGVLPRVAPNPAVIDGGVLATERRVNPLKRSHQVRP